MEEGGDCPPPTRGPPHPSAIGNVDPPMSGVSSFMPTTADTGIDEYAQELGRLLAGEMRAARGTGGVVRGGGVSKQRGHPRVRPMGNQQRLAPTSSYEGVRGPAVGIPVHPPTVHGYGPGVHPPASSYPGYAVHATGAPPATYAMRDVAAPPPQYVVAPQPSVGVPAAHHQRGYAGRAQEQQRGWGAHGASTGSLREASDPPRPYKRPSTWVDGDDKARRYGFTEEQMKCLYAQILAFKDITARKEISQKLLSNIVPQPLRTRPILETPPERFGDAGSLLVPPARHAARDAYGGAGPSTSLGLDAAARGAEMLDAGGRVRPPMSEGEFDRHLLALRELTGKGVVRGDPASRAVDGADTLVRKRAMPEGAEKPESFPSLLRLEEASRRRNRFIAQQKKMEADAEKALQVAPSHPTPFPSKPSQNAGAGRPEGAGSVRTAEMHSLVEAKYLKLQGSVSGSMMSAAAPASKLPMVQPLIMPRFPKPIAPLADVVTNDKKGNVVTKAQNKKSVKELLKMLDEEEDRYVDTLIERDIEVLEEKLREVRDRGPDKGAAAAEGKGKGVQRILDAPAAPNDTPHKPSGAPAVRGTEGVGLSNERLEYMLRIQALKLRVMQREMRKNVLEIQEGHAGMTAKAYRKIAKQCQHKRDSLSKSQECLSREKVNARIKDIRKGRQQWLDMCWSGADKVRTHTKKVLQFHAKLGADYSKFEKEDRRRKMMLALENKDAEAYARLVAEEGGTGDFGKNKAGLDELTRFLDDTESYLNDLSDKVRRVKIQSAIERGDHPMDTGGTDVHHASADHAEGSKAGGSKLYDIAHSLDRSIQLPHLLSDPGLRPYQVVGLKWMTSLHENHLNGILADEMGLGKTVQVIGLFAWLMEYKQNMGPHLVIVPNAVVPNWRNELRRWLPAARNCVYIGKKDERMAVFQSSIALEATLRANVVITTYEYALRDRSKLGKVSWQYVVMDEAHRIKDRASKLAEAMDKLESESRLLLTGTPLQNDLQELWSLLNYLLPQVFDSSSKKAFREWFDEHLSNQQEFDEEKLAKRAVVIQRLHQALEPFMLRRRVEDVEQTLPPRITNTILCPLSSIESVAYRWIAPTSKLRDIRGSQYNVMNKAMELKKLCNHITLTYPDAVLDHSITELVKTSGKLFMLDRMLVKFRRAGHRVLIFSTMTKALDIVQRYVQWRQWPFRRIDGNTAFEEREQAIQDFNNADDNMDSEHLPFIFLLSIRAAGRGLNLQSADTVILYDPDPNPKNEEQAIARAHRIGQKNEVRVFHLEAVVDHELPTEMPAKADGPSAMVLEDSGVGRTQGGERGGLGGLGGFGMRGVYRDSIESIIRKEIQKFKIDMAHEVIDAGHFDLETSAEDKKKTLQTYLKEHVEDAEENIVLGLKDINRLLARNAAEIKLYDAMDEDEDLWLGSLYTSVEDVPGFLTFSTQELEQARQEVKNK